MFSDERHQRRVQSIGHHVCGRHNPTYVSTVSLVKLKLLVTRPSGGNRNLACRACALPVNLPCRWRGRSCCLVCDGKDASVPTNRTPADTSVLFRWVPYARTFTPQNTK
jgi:hypothetical protein